MKAKLTFIGKKIEKPNDQKTKKNKKGIFQLRQFSIFFTKISGIDP